jgi:hypothetical protein
MRVVESPALQGSEFYTPGRRSGKGRLSRIREPEEILRQRQSTSVPRLIDKFCVLPTLWVQAAL